MNNIFNSVNNEEAAYLLGFISADGCISKTKNSIRIHLKNSPSEIKLINKFYKILELKNKIYYPNDNSILLIANNKKMKESLLKLGIKSAKTFSLPFLSLEKNLMPHYIRGYFDGDGWISYSKPNNNSYITTGFIGNPTFCSDLNKYLNKVIGLNLCETKKNKMIQLQCSGCFKCYKLLDYMYKNSSIYLDRKYLLYNSLHNFINNKSKEQQKLNKLQCPNCNYTGLIKNGSKKLKSGKVKRYKCPNCNKSTINPI